MDRGTSVLEYIAKLEAENAQLRKALQTLRNEVTGTLQAHELAIRYDHGNSNWTCLEMALEMAEKALQARQDSATECKPHQYNPLCHCNACYSHYFVKQSQARREGSEND